MNTESPALGESAGLEVPEVETKLSNNKTTVLDSLQFQPDLTVSQPSLYGEPAEHELFDGNPLQADPIDECYQAELAHREEVAKRQVARGQTMSLRLNLRLAELRRLARHRIEQGNGLNLTEWLVSIAVTLKAREGWAWTKTKGGRKAKRWRQVMGLPSLWEQAYRAGMNLPDSILKPIDERVSGDCSRQWLEPCEQGEWLDLTVEEQTRLKITTMEAEGETPSDRRARVEREQAERRNARKREQRIAAGKSPRDGSRTELIRRLAVQFGKSEETIRRMIRKGKLDVTAYGTAQKREEGLMNPLCGATSGHPDCRAFEPASSVPSAESALGVASQPGSVPPSSETSGVRPKPYWAADDQSSGLAVEPRAEASAPALDQGFPYRPRRRDFWPHSLSPDCPRPGDPAAGEAKRLAAEQAVAGYRIRKQRDATRLQATSR